eukprot:2935221-Rhodomonas_salina.1
MHKVPRLGKHTLTVRLLRRASRSLDGAMAPECPRRHAVVMLCATQTRSRQSAAALACGVVECTKGWETRHALEQERWMGRKGQTKGECEGWDRRPG